ncbi:hypothetical protein Zmor_023209 [Zophobas morio]|uniref:Uncharacterized protein n=1 Tax=Zophobas morio TaxID=2755281 RepID=A0AA38M776_9CUCU|nr:hypothetical protein Zmor_023209 [Zophobas morio]
MAEFSLIEALENLYIDPFPTKKYRAIVNRLRNIAAIMEELHEVRMCCLDDTVKKLSTSVPEAPENLKNRFVPTSEICKELTKHQVLEKFVYMLRKMLFYIIVKLNRCTSEDAASILHDFKALQVCIFVFRKYSTWNNSSVDDIIILFQRKLIQMVKELNRENCETKFHLFNIVRNIIIELGKHPVYSAPTVKFLHEEVKIFYEHVKTLDISKPVDGYIFENYLTYLFILNDIIGRNFINNNKDEGKLILSGLRSVLTENATQSKVRPREAYLVQNILKIIEVYELM